MRGERVTVGSPGGTCFGPFTTNRGDQLSRKECMPRDRTAGWPFGRHGVKHFKAVEIYLQCGLALQSVDKVLKKVATEMCW